MNYFIFCFSLLFSYISYAGFESGLPSSVSGLDTPNSHTLLYDKEQKPLIIRGNAPRNKTEIKQLLHLGIKKILAFKNQSKHEIDSEKKQIKKIDSQVEFLHIPFLWRDITDFQLACQQSIQALQFIETAATQQTPVFFHCTVGEDRTGYLAGLYRLFFQNWTKDKAFENEMCQRGFGAGNPKKPYRAVVLKIRQSLTPLYLKMAFLLRHAEELTEEICEQDPEFWTASVELDPEWFCSVATLYKDF